MANNFWQGATSHFNDSCLCKLIVNFICNPTFEGVQAASESSMHIVGKTKSMTAKTAPNVVKGYFMFSVTSRSKGAHTAPVISCNKLCGLVVKYLKPILNSEGVQPHLYINTDCCIDISAKIPVPYFESAQAPSSMLIVGYHYSKIFLHFCKYCTYFVREYRNK